MLMALGGRIRRFAAASRGAVTVEFVVTLPVLIAVLAFASQYGRAMQVRNALDVATRDATRFLSRAPLNQTGQVPPTFVGNAEQLVLNRIDGLADDVRFVSVTSDALAAQMEVEVDVSFPWLALVSFGENDYTSITMTAGEVWPRTE